MRILVDADACPVVDICVRMAKRHKIECLLLCDTAHEMRREGAKTLTFSKGADSVDFALVNMAKPGDIVVTQDYGLAAMALARGARVLHQNGPEYTAENIDSMLGARHVAKKIRSAGGRTKGPAKRTRAQDEAFEAALAGLLARGERARETQT